MRIAAREAAADVDGVDQHARGHDQLADLAERLAEGGRHDGLGAHMEGDAKPRRALAGFQQKRRRLLLRSAELPLERDEAVRVGTGDPEEQREVVGPAGLLEHFVQLVAGIEGEAPDAEIVIGAGDGAARLHRVHEIELGALDRRHALDLDQRGDVERTDTGLHQGVDDLGRVIGLGGIEHAAWKVREKPLRRAMRGMGPES